MLATKSNLKTPANLTVPTYFEKLKKKQNKQKYKLFHKFSEKNGQELSASVEKLLQRSYFTQLKVHKFLTNPI
jgi:hypothetical protein